MDDDPGDCCKCGKCDNPLLDLIWMAKLLKETFERFPNIVWVITNDG